MANLGKTLLHLAILGYIWSKLAYIWLKWATLSLTRLNMATNSKT